MARLVAFYTAHEVSCPEGDCCCDPIPVMADVSFDPGGLILGEALLYAAALAEDDVERQLRERAESS